MALLILLAIAWFIMFVYAIHLKRKAFRELMNGLEEYVRSLNKKENQ